MSSIRFFSVLSNGNRVDGWLSIGSFVLTQWGLRAVVSHGSEPVTGDDSITQGERASFGRF